MLPEDIIEIIEKYQTDSNIEKQINEGISQIIESLQLINEIIAKRVYDCLLDLKQNPETEGLLNDSSILRNYINSIKLIELKDDRSSLESKDNKAEMNVIFDEKVYPYLVSDDLCPFCNVKLVPHIIYYQRINDNSLIDETVNWYRCPNCRKLYVLDCDAETFRFKDTNIVLNKERYDSVPYIDIYSAIVLSNTRRCSSKHRTKDVIADIPVLDKDGGLHYKKINASYCYDCKEFTILKEDFNSIDDVILCKVIDKTVEYDSSNSSDFDIEQNKSILYKYGYNVKSQKSLSDKQRHIILSSVLESNIMNKRDIIDHLNTLISRGEKISKWKEATQKWIEDRQFVSEYKKGDLPEYIFDKIIMRYKKPIG